MAISASPNGPTVDLANLASASARDELQTYFNVEQDQINLLKAGSNLADGAITSRTISMTETAMPDFAVSMQPTSANPTPLNLSSLVLPTVSYPTYVYLNINRLVVSIPASASGQYQFFVEASYGVPPLDTNVAQVPIITNVGQALVTNGAMANVKFAFAANTTRQINLRFYSVSAVTFTSNISLTGSAGYVTERHQ